MCRFLLVKTPQPIQPASLLHAFAEMARQSTVGGEEVWQGDGWGVSWLDSKQGWQSRKSLQPIWTDCADFATLPASQRWVVHARSASFPQHKGVLAYNQPYHHEDYAFVFNGLLRGVKLPQRVTGAIGAQKIWSLLQHYLATQPPVAALQQLRDTLLTHTQEIKALNIGLANSNHCYAFCTFATHSAYYTLQIHHSAELQMICSEPLRGYAFTPIEPNQVVTTVKA